MNRYLLDTNIVSALARDPKGNVARRLSTVDPDLVATSVIVACEVRYGLAKQPDSQKALRAVQFLETMTILPLDQSVAVTYAEARAWLRKNGQEIGGNDLLIAAHALATAATLVTDDKAFAAVPNLRIENWLRV